MRSSDPTRLIVNPVIPVITIENARDAVPLARALLAGGLRVVEITLRTPAALDAIRAVAGEVPDVIVGAAGVKHLVRPEDVKEGAAVLDVGVTRETDPGTGTSKVYGDIAPGVEDVAGWLSPNPGGVGPMTVALLMTNVVEAAERTIRA